MKLIIDIPEEEYKEIMADTSKGSTFEDMMTKAIKNATPLEKHDEKVIKETVESIWGKPCTDAVNRQEVLDLARKGILVSNGNYESVCNAINQLPPVNPQEHSRDMEEIAEIMRCDADAETKCKMISNILNAKPHYFENQESCDTCEHSDEIDGNNCYECVKDMRNNYSPKKQESIDDVLDKIRAEIEQMPSELTADGRRMIRRGSVFRIINKYRKGQTNANSD